MKVLWIVNTIFPFPAKELGMKRSVFGGWMNSLFDCLNKEKDVNLAVATVYNGKYFKKFKDGKNIYYLIPTKNTTKFDIKLEKYWEDISKDFKPDVIHIHGTEYPNALSFLNINKKENVVTSIQGLVSSYYSYYNANISDFKIIKNITLRDIIKRDNLFKSRLDFKKRGIYEKQILQKSNYIIGRTTWDYACTFDITDIKKYRAGNESLRESFYNKNWDNKNYEKYSIYISQASYPIKGFHLFLDALKIIKEKYPNVKVYVAGSNVTNFSTFKNKLKLTGYGKYLKKLIKKYNLSENIIFTGLLNEQEVANKLEKVNVFVQASVIENSPNSLGEAMLVGTPIVASNVGGTSDMLMDKEEGFLYPSTDSQLLAYYVCKLFEDKKLCEKFSKNSKIHSNITHNREENAKSVLNIYKEIINQK